jgi:hypothetical protein
MNWSPMFQQALTFSFCGVPDIKSAAAAARQEIGRRKGGWTSKKGQISNRMRAPLFTNGQ